MPFGPQSGEVSRPFWLLVLLMGSGTLGMHVFVPILPLIEADFGVSLVATQATISLYMVSLAVGQLVIGPISDRVGRRPMLLFGLSLYLLAGIGAALAPSLGWLLLARVLQAFGGCAGLVLGRAIVHDTQRDSDAASTIAILNAVLLISPAIAPLVGIWLAGSFGWRAVPLLLSAISVFALLGTARCLSESHTPEPTALGELTRRYWRLLASPGFMSAVIGGSLATTTLFTLLATSPFILTERLGIPLKEVGYYYAIFVIGIMIGSLIANRFVRRVGFENLILGATFLSAASGTFLLVCVLSDALTLIRFVCAGFVFVMMAGVMGPLTLTRSVDNAGALKGSASGVYGLFQMALGAACITLASAGTQIESGTAFVLCIAGVSSFAIFARAHATARRAA